MTSYIILLLYHYTIIALQVVSQFTFFLTKTEKNIDTYGTSYIICIWLARKKNKDSSDGLICFHRYACS